MPFGSNSGAYTIVLFIGILLGIFIFSVFMPPRKRGKYLHSPSLLVMHDYLNFKIMISLWFIRLGYVVSACILTLYALVMMFDVHFGVGLLVLLIGNITLRLLMELSTVLLSIHSNLNQITDKIMDRQPEAVASVSAGQFFGDISGQIKQKQEQMRARAEAERQQYGQNNAQGYGQPQYPPQEQQQAVLAAIESEDCTPSHVQAMKMRKFCDEGKLNEDVIASIMQEEKPNQVEQFKMPREKLSRYFSPGTSAQKMEETIIKALELWRKREMNRDAR